MKYNRKDGFSQYASVSQATNKFLLYLKKINLGYEYVNYKESINRVLYEDIISNIDRPNSDLSAMDGYAVRLSDLENSKIKNFSKIFCVLATILQVPETSICSNKYKVQYLESQIPEKAKK